MRNLNGYEIGGRNLRVDNACTEKSRLEIQSLLQGMLGDCISQRWAPLVWGPHSGFCLGGLSPKSKHWLIFEVWCTERKKWSSRGPLNKWPYLVYFFYSCCDRVNISLSCLTMIPWVTWVVSQAHQYLYHSKLSWQENKTWNFALPSFPQSI